MKQNDTVRAYAKSKGVKLWQIAAQLQITDSSFSRKLRFELPLDEKERILAIIDEIAAQKENAAC